MSEIYKCQNCGAEHTSKESLNYCYFTLQHLCKNCGIYKPIPMFGIKKVFDGYQIYIVEQREFYVHKDNYNNLPLSNHKLFYNEVVKWTNKTFKYRSGAKNRITKLLHLVIAYMNGTVKEYLGRE